MNSNYFQQIAVQRSISDVINDFARAEIMIKEAYRIIDDAEQLCNQHKISVKSNVHNRHHYRHEYVIERMRRDAWLKLIDMTGLKQIMDATAIEAFEKTLYDAAPAFDDKTVRGTLLSQMQSAEFMFARGLVEVFRRLSGRYRRNQDAVFRVPKKVIIENVAQSGMSGMYISSRAFDRINDIDRVFKTLDCKKFNNHALIAELGQSWQESDLHECEYYKARAYKKGTLHLEFRRDDLLEKANEIIAQWYGNTLGGRK